VVGPHPSYDRQVAMASSLVQDFGVRSIEDGIERVTAMGSDTWGVLTLVGDVLGTRSAVPGGSVPADWVIRVETDPVSSAVVTGFERRADAAFRGFAPFLVVAYPTHIDETGVRLGPRPADDAWVTPGFDDSGWELWKRTWVGYATPSAIGVRLPLHVESVLTSGTLIVASRACVERAWMDGVVSYSNACPRERRGVEVDRDFTRLVIAPPELSPGPHLLALDLVVRDKWYDFRVYDEPPKVHEAKAE
jgi:hypothetical protein